jgi:tRNA G18 (ribose-2'-O)-methylase SpoU
MRYDSRKTRGYCGIGVFHSKSSVNLGTLWRSAYNFNLDFIFTVGRRYEKQPSDTLNAVNHIPLYHYTDMDDLINHLPAGCQLIGIELHPKAAYVSDFKHPERACYLLGAEDVGLNDLALKHCSSIIQIPHTYNCLNVAVAGSIVMYDRCVKMNGDWEDE